MSPTRLTWSLVALLLALLLAALTPLWRSSQRLATPVVEPVAGFTATMATYLRALTSLRAILAENEVLRQRLAETMSQQAGIEALRGELAELRTLAKLPPAPVFSSLGAEVVGRHDDDTGTSYTINRGRRDGLSPGLAVVAALTRGEGGELSGMLIGTIRQVGEQRATFAATTSPLTRVVAELAVGERASALAVGEYNLAIRLELLPVTTTVPTGAPVVTSHLNELLPPGLLIGHVSSIQQAPGDFFSQATVAPPVPPERFRFVSVLLPAGSD